MLKCTHSVIIVSSLITITTSIGSLPSSRFMAPVQSPFCSASLFMFTYVSLLAISSIKCILLQLYFTRTYPTVLSSITPFPPNCTNVYFAITMLNISLCFHFHPFFVSILSKSAFCMLLNIPLFYFLSVVYLTCTIIHSVHSI